jgi:toxin ParE1/3/4
LLISKAPVLPGPFCYAIVDRCLKQLTKKAALCLRPCRARPILPLGQLFRAMSRYADIRNCFGTLTAALSPRTLPTIFSPLPGSGLPHGAVAEYRLAERARVDLIDIYDFTEGRFGTYQADAYYAGLIRSFGLLADFPLIGQTADNLSVGYRRFRFQSHLIFYTIQPDHVEIRAIIHSSQDIRPQLFD